MALAYAALRAVTTMAPDLGCHRDRGSAPLAGDGLVPEAGHQTTRAIDIRAPVSQVWPWLIQMGQGRGGLYTYEWIENALGAQIYNLDRIDPEIQPLQVGDRIRLTPELYLGRIPRQF